MSSCLRPSRLMFDGSPADVCQGPVIPTIAQLQTSGMNARNSQDWRERNRKLSGRGGDISEFCADRAQDRLVIYHIVFDAVLFRGHLKSDCAIANSDGKLLFTIKAFEIACAPDAEPVPITDNRRERLTTIWQSTSSLLSRIAASPGFSWLGLQAPRAGCSGIGQECYPSCPLGEDLRHRYCSNIQAILGELVVESPASLALQRMQWSRRHVASSVLASFDLVLHDVNLAAVPVDISSSANFLVSNGTILLSVPASGVHVEDASVGALTLESLEYKVFSLLFKDHSLDEAVREKGLHDLCCNSLLLEQHMKIIKTGDLVWHRIGRVDLLRATFSGRPRLTKLMVLLIFLGDTAHMIGSVQFYWELLIACHRSSSWTCETRLPWGMFVTLPVNYVTTFAVQSFYGRRVWIISGNKKHVTIAILFTAILQFGLGGWCTLEAIRIGTVEYFFTDPFILYAAAVSTLCDFLITGAVIKYMCNSDLRRRVNFIQDLAIVFINMGALTCLMSVLVGVIMMHAQVRSVVHKVTYGPSARFWMARIADYLGQFKLSLMVCSSHDEVTYEGDHISARVPPPNSATSVPNEEEQYEFLHPGNGHVILDLTITSSRRTPRVSS
ncbi:hypothetical protein BU15DRAFT_79539 [Melanogaster broomeanus]|nr:hypothetical protein BU15DRAFT_79539 [Melanogaster broomeanus]